MSHGELPSGYAGHFLQVFEAAATAKNLKIVRWLENGAVLVNEDNEELQTYFTNVYRRCKDYPPDDWQDIIEHFMSQIFLEEKPPDNVADVSEQLRARLGQPFEAEPSGFQPWFQPLGETELVVNLVVDYPGRMLYVTPEMLNKSGRSEGEWLEVALRRLRESTPAEWFTVLDEETGIRVACMGDSYDAARALILDELLPETAERGCFVAPLGRDVMFFLPVSLEVVRYIHLLKVLAEKNYETTPYPISREVYWVHQREWTHFPIEIGEDSVEVYPPMEMLRFLGWVEEEEDDEEE